jgi:mRNA interferase MazF
VRIAVEPSRRHGVRKPSQMMVDKLFTVSSEAMGEVVGQLESRVLVDLDLALRSWLMLP